MCAFTYILTMFNTLLLNFRFLHELYNPDEICNIHFYKYISDIYAAQADSTNGNAILFALLFRMILLGFFEFLLEYC